MSALSTIFVGVNPQQARNIIGEYVKSGKWTTFVQPFCGRFGLTEVIADLVESPEHIWTSDICVFSAIVGYWLMGRSINELGLALSDEALLLSPLVEGAEEPAAAWLLVLKYAQLKHRKAYYYQCAAKELTRNWNVYLDRMTAQLKQLKSKLGGIQFRILDYKVEIQEHMHNSEALIVCDPPCYEKGYTNMFNPHGVFSWNEPTVPEFRPAEFADLLRLCEDAEATVLCMQYPSHENIGWRVVASCSMPNRRVNKYWNFVCNKPLKPLVARDYPELVRPENARFECFTKDEIQHGSKVQLLKVEKQVALYYRDLLVHKLADSGGDDHFLLLIDGKVSAVIGLVFNFFTRRGLDYIYLNYAIEVKNSHHSRLHKLITALVYSAQFKQEVVSQVSHIQNTLQFRDFQKMRSTKLSHTQHLWNMPATADIVSKEKLKDGMFKIVYEHRFSNKRYHQCVVEFYQHEQALAKRGG